MNAFFESMTAQPDTDNHPFTCRDLEHVLAGPDFVSTERELVQFETQITQIESLQRTGLTPQQFAQAEMLLVALQSAVKCLSRGPSVSS